MGAAIQGLGTSTIEIQGVDQLGGARHRIIPDRIEAGTFLIAALATGGEIRVRGVIPHHLGALLDKLEEVGARISTGKDWIFLRRQLYKLRDVERLQDEGKDTHL